MSGRAFLTVDGGSGPADPVLEFRTRVRNFRPDADPVSAPLPAGVSHLLAADEALIPHRWGAHITLCGKKVRRPNVEAWACDRCDTRRAISVVNPRPFLDGIATAVAVRSIADEVITLAPDPRR